MFNSFKKLCSCFFLFFSDVTRAVAVVYRLSVGGAFVRREHYSLVTGSGYTYWHIIDDSNLDSDEARV